MKNLLLFCLLVFIFSSCDKDHENNNCCNIEQAYIENAAKVTITSGIWGTTSSMEGDCMPTAPGPNPRCKHCPVKRTVQIYQYTRQSDATPSGNSTIFFDSFNTQLVAQVEADNDGFFQTSIPAGNYSIVIVENGKLYANGGDGQGGLSPFSFSSGLQKINIAMTYKAVF